MGSRRAQFEAGLFFFEAGWCGCFLKPHGLFSIGLKLGTGEQRDKIGRKYSYFEEQEIRNILSNEGFYHISQHLGEAKGLDGESAKFIIILSHA